MMNKNMDKIDVANQQVNQIRVEEETQKTAPSSTVEKQSKLDDERTGQPVKELGGPKGLEPTRYGDWESKGRCYDF